MDVWDITFEMDWDPPGAGQLRVRAECDDGSKCEFEFRLPVDVAEKLYTDVAGELAERAREMAEAKAAYERRDPRWMPKAVLAAAAQELLDDGVYDDDPAKRADAERVARGE